MLVLSSHFQHHYSKIEQLLVNGRYVLNLDCGFRILSGYVLLVSYQAPAKPYPRSDYGCIEIFDLPHCNFGIRRFWPWKRTQIELDACGFGSVHFWALFQYFSQFSNLISPWFIINQYSSIQLSDLGDVLVLLSIFIVLVKTKVNLGNLPFNFLVVKDNAHEDDQTDNHQNKTANIEVFIWRVYHDCGSYRYCHRKNLEVIWIWVELHFEGASCRNFAITRYSRIYEVESTPD